MRKLRRVAWSDDDVCVVGAPAANDEGAMNAFAQLRQQQQQRSRAIVAMDSRVIFWYFSSSSSGSVIMLRVSGVSKK